ncbi:hypothetical protein ACS3QZ_08095 [Shimia sp. W99]
MGASPAAIVARTNGATKSAPPEYFGQNEGRIADISQASHIKALIAAELRDYDPECGTRVVGWGTPMSPEWHRVTLADFRAVMIEPEEVDVKFSGGVSMACWAVTRSNGDYRVVWVPSAETFSLVTESKFGPVDIGVHGDAIGVFGSI